jgi:two-component system, NarL family, nitrate/nitrite response regulator NarL
MREDRNMSFGQGALDPVRIVIADDDRLFAEMVRMQLSSREEVEIVGIAATGKEAVDLAEELEPDLVLMDVSMPVLDGIEAAETITAGSDPPAVVLVTGEDGELDARAYQAGATAYLRKSAGLAALVDVIVAVSLTAPVC